MDNESNKKEMYEETPKFTQSLSLNSIQKDWKTPCEFPFCPNEISKNPISDYATNLKIGEVFSKNKYSSSIILDFAISKDENKIWILCESSDKQAIKPWLLADITFKNNYFIHGNLGSFFERNGAKKYFAIKQGLEWTGEETFDDLT